MNLPILQTDRGFFTLFELDHPQELAEGFGLALDVASNQEWLKTIYQDVQSAVAPSVSGIVLEPTFSFPAWLARPAKTEKTTEPSPSLVLRLDEPTADATSTTMPHITDSWSIPEVKNNYAVALVELHYHPSELEALQKKQFIAEVADSCHREGVALILKLLISSQPADTPLLMPPAEAQLTAVQEFRTLPDALALKVPDEALATATLTAELDIPWLVTHGTNEPLGFPQFQSFLQQGLENGAKGFLAGSIFWSDMYGMRRADQAPDTEAIKTFLSSTLPERVASTSRIVAETVAV